MNRVKNSLLNVLIVTSDRKFYESAKHLLGEMRERGCETQWRKSGRTALKAINSGKCDVCLIDYRFGSDENPSFLREAVLVDCRTPVILLIDEENEKLRIEAIQAGAAYCGVMGKLDAPLLDKVIGLAVERVAGLTELHGKIVKFRNLVETLPVMIYVAEPKPPYSPIYVSPAFQAFGYAPEEWDNYVDFWVRLIHPEDRQRILKETDAMRKSGRKVDFEYRIISKDGKTHWVQDRGDFVCDSSGKMLWWQGIILDITERKNAESALVENELRYRNIFVNANDLIYVHDLDGNFLSLNAATERVMGYSPEEAAKLNMRQVIAPEHIELARQMLAEKLAGRSQTVYETTCIAKDGRRIILEVNSSAIYKDGIPVAVQGIARDITERKLSEQRIQQSEAQMQAVFSAMSDIVMVFDSEGTYLKISQSNPHLSYNPAIDLVGKKLHKIFPQSLADYFLTSIRESLETRKPVRMEYSLKNGGEEYWYAAMVSPMMTDSVVVVARNVSEGKRAEKALKEREDQYRELFENANDLIFTLDLKGNLMSLNRAGEIITGYTREEAAKLTPDQLITPENVQKIRSMISRKLAGEESTLYELGIVSKRGRNISFELNTRLIYQNGKPAGIQGIGRDITERKRAEEALVESEERYRLLGEGIRHQVWTAEPNGQINYVNRRTSEYFGRSAEQIIGEGWHSAVHPEDLMGGLKSWSAALKTGEDYEAEFRLRRYDGRYFWFQARAVAGRDAEGNIISWFGTNTDIDDRKKAEAKLTYFAGHDTLTNLPNRARFMHHLERAIKRAEHNPKFQFAVLFLDLDRFKIINDSLGHSIGDRLLIEIAERLEDCLRPNDIVARLGGDEFTVLLTRIGGEGDAVRVANRFLEKLSAPFKLNNYEVFTSASIGIIISDEVDRQPEDFLRDADTAMYRAKEAGKSRYEIFDREMHIRNINLLRMENDLRRAIERNEFRVFYQPIIELNTGKILEFEALIRWQHPDQGLVPPNDFIGIAEETGLIIPIGKWILEEACRQTAEWQNRFPQYKNLFISVNLSAKQLLHPNIIAQIEEVLERTGFDPHYLKLEVTESMVMENGDKSLAVINDFHALGMSISTDDFGTGYSSLSYLHQFPFNRLKIDRSFVGKMEKDLKSEAIVRTILMLGQNLEIETVAEGIENEHQLWQLRSLGCRLGQGYFFSKPVDAEAAEKILQEGFLVNIANLEKPFNCLKLNQQSTIELEEIQ